MLEVALVLLGAIIATLVFGGIHYRSWINNQATLMEALNNDVNGLLIHKDQIIGVVNKNAVAFEAKVKELEDRVGKIQTVGFLTKRVQDGSGSN